MSAADFAANLRAEMGRQGLEVTANRIYWEWHRCHKADSPRD